jgi:hypothetical protein
MNNNLHLPREPLHLNAGYTCLSQLLYESDPGFENPVAAVAGILLSFSVPATLPGLINI